MSLSGTVLFFGVKWFKNIGFPCSTKLLNNMRKIQSKLQRGTAILTNINLHWTNKQRLVYICCSSDICQKKNWQANLKFYWSRKHFHKYLLDEATVLGARGSCPNGTSVLLTETYWAVFAGHCDINSIP